MKMNKKKKPTCTPEIHAENIKIYSYCEYCDQGRYFFSEEEHVHRLDGKPLIGTTTALGVIAKPLTWWASGMAVEKFGWLNPKKNTPEKVQEALKEGYTRVMGLSIENYEKLLVEAYRAHNTRKEQAADDGTDMHAKLENYVKDCIAFNFGQPKASNEPIVKDFADWAILNVKRFIWSEVHCYSEKYWLGGISDLGYLTKDNQLFVGDFKSSKEAYPSQFLQEALYMTQLMENGGFSRNGRKVMNAPLEVCGLAVFCFGDGFKPFFHYHPKGCEAGALAAVELYKVLQLMEK